MIQIKFQESKSDALSRAKGGIRKAAGACFLASGAVLTSGMILNAHADKLQPAYMGVRLGETQEHVRYSRGYPTSVTESSESGDEYLGYRVYFTSGNDPKNAMPPDKSITDYSNWSYDLDGARLDVKFSDDDTTVTMVSCFSLEYQICEPLLGVEIGQTEDSVVSTLGTPDSSSVGENAKRLIYENLGITITLARQQVYQLSLVSDPLDK